MKDQKALWAWVGGVIVVAAVVVAAVWHFHGSGTPVSTTPSGPVAVHAPVGQLISGFPQELILDSTAQVNNSYSINYSTSTNQYTAEWVSSSSPASLYAKYQAYIKANGWTLANHADLSTFKGVYAKNASSSAAMNVIILAQGNGSKITISYIAQ